MLRTLGRFILILLLTSSWISGQQTNPTKSFLEQICELIGIDAAIYQKLAGVRGSSDPSYGNRVMVFTTSTNAERIIWNCERCWSLHSLQDSRLVAVKSDGIWISTTGTTNFVLKVPAERIHTVLGGRADRSGHLLVLQRRQDELENSNCSYVFRIADLTTGILSATSEYGDRCIHENELVSLYNLKSRVNGTQVLSNTETDPRKLLIGTIPDSADPVSYRFLTPSINELDDGIDRFDPVWVSQTEIGYLARFI